MGTHDHPQQLGKYLLAEKLGRGGMAEVWKALDTQLQRYVAIKILNADLRNDPHFSSRFQREAQVIASLRHANIVQIHDFHIVKYAGIKEPVAYMVMDYVIGENLAEYIAATSAKKRFPSSEEIVHLFLVVGSALDYAHQKGIIHRDIKPANIMLDQSAAPADSMGEPVLTDFGLVKLVSSPSVTLKGMWLGTPHYTSPEQAQGSPIDERSDIYSLGVILYEICTGTKPFSGNTVQAILKQHIDAPPPDPQRANPAISAELAEVITRSLAKDPEARFHTALSLANALAQAFKTSTLTASDSTFPKGAVPEPTAIERVIAPAELKDTPSYMPFSHPPANLADSQFMLPIEEKHDTITQTNTATQAIKGTNTAKAAKRTASMQTPTVAQTRGKRGGGLLPIVLIALVIALLGSSLGLGAFLWLPRQGPAPNQIATVSPIVGQGFFVSSGALNANGIPSINDELLINLHNLKAPADGKVYYGWLLRDKKQPTTTPISLGMLTVKQGAVYDLYQGSSDHTNLLAISSRLLITEEDIGPPPMLPAPDFSTVRYYAELSQDPDPNDASHLSPLDHLRSLLAQDPTLKGLDSHSNLAIWLLQQTGRVLEWANSARDYWNVGDTQLMRDQFLRILVYLDGESAVHADLPVGKVPLQIAQVALLGLPVPDIQDPLSADYLHQVSGHLSAIAQAPGATQEQRVRIAYIISEINSVRNWLEDVRLYAKQLINMPATQLLSPEAMGTMDDMVTQAFHAYTGQPDPATGEVQSGVVQIHNDIERLAAFAITARSFG